jgi:hypothetical protein
MMRASDFVLNGLNIAANVVSSWKTVVINEILEPGKLYWIF